MANKRPEVLGTASEGSSDPKKTNRGTQTDVVVESDLKKLYDDLSLDIVNKFAESEKKNKAKIKKNFDDTKTETSNLVNQVKKDVSATKSNILRIKEDRIEIQNIKEGIKEDSGKNIEILAVFVALFTFASTNIQLYNSAQNFRQLMILCITNGVVLLLFIANPTTN
jgi:hypothetical protein